MIRLETPDPQVGRPRGPFWAKWAISGPPGPGFWPKRGVRGAKNRGTDWAKIGVRILPFRKSFCGTPQLARGASLEDLKGGAMADGPSGLLFCFLREGPQKIL